MRRALEHPLAPVVGAVLFGLVYLAAAPATADMAGHTFRAWLFSHDGPSVWNAQWYGGHHVLGYSLLFAPAAWVLGPALTGVAASVVATAAFGRIVRNGPATWLFAGGMAANVAIGRMPFALGIALAVLAWIAPRRLAAALAFACVWASPVAGAFLLLAAVARRAWWLGVPVLVGGGLLVALFPEGGPDRFVASAFWPMLGVSIAAAGLLSRTLRPAALLNVGMLVAAFLIPTTFGQNALRLAVLLGPPLLVIGARPGPARFAVIAVLLYLQWLPAVRAVGEAAGDPSTQAGFYTEAREFLERSTRPGERVEVAFTRNHWEAARLATSVPLARGWERQLDQKTNPLFYGGFTTERYQAWLSRNAVRWVALPDAPLDYSAREEAKLLERRPAFLRLAFSSPEWRIWEVRDPSPPASDGARMVSAGPDGFSVRTRGTTIVRQRYTRYWRARGGTVRPAAGGWTEVDPRGGSLVSVRASFTIR